MSLADRVELFVFTYNRAASLSRLIGDFASSPFKDCRITVLDNCSTDNTGEVAAHGRKAMPGLIHIRHPKNIGGLANYLRAIELARAEYTWVLCDDDRFDFQGSEDLVVGLESAGFDLFSVGVTGHDLPGGYTGTVQRFASEHPFFLGHSLVPALVFRTALFDPACLRSGYDNVYTMFPHFPFLAHLHRVNASLSVTKRKIINKGQNLGYSRFGFIEGWLAGCSRIPERAIRAQAMRDVFYGMPFWKMLAYSFLTEREYRTPRHRSAYYSLMRQAAVASPGTFSKLTLALPALYLPGFAHRQLWARYQAHRKATGQEMPEPDEDR